MVYRLEISSRPGMGHGTEKMLSQASQYFGMEITAAEKSDVLTFKANISEAEIEKIAGEIVNPVLQDGIVGQVKDRNFDWYLAVGFLPGVTDNVARTAREATADILGRKLGEDEHIFSSREFFITAPNLSKEDIVKVGEELVGNVLIESVTVLSFDDWNANGAPENLPLIDSETEPEVNLLSLEISDEELETVSREKTLALTLREMKVIQEYIRKASNDPEKEP